MAGKVDVDPQVQEEGSDGTLTEGALVKTPLHEQVKERILRRIILGTWGEGFVLPPETELARQFGVSYGTIRRAMTDLTASGVIMRRRKTGTVVTGRTPHHSMSQFYRYYRLHGRDGRLLNSDTVLADACHRPATQSEAELLEIPAGAPVAFMLRRRFHEGRVVMVDRVTVPLALAPDFPATIEEMPTLVYKWLLEHHGLRLAAVREKLVARLATPEDLKWLELPADAPRAVLDIEEVSYDSLNRPLVAMRHAALTEDHCYINEIR
ncbi:GntR family transcriptional regulator [Pseudooceanicola sp. CBS1P-1]|uniref:UTRA domain-containing protein n=1 Tax=Pseudooceanicola albus TaxID=2692189 RepID=A0A6L7FXV9_9RHOB|nr:MULTISPECIES: GntR family transcriptional regulator [Pseudooceanicola]MBT9383168.1 GntR family transcriptional regulator [Pseudooceanicola endophyticus]MXN16509.1 UTRA domain-containing protein [Pseudooceanicola albus]